MNVQQVLQQVVQQPGAIGLGLAVLAIVICAALGIWLYLRRRPTPEELERRRRETLYLRGKISDGEVIEFDGTSIMYSYYVAGVGYTAMQDLSALLDFLPSDPMALIGPVCLKHDPRNPPNSIVVCEKWSGLRHLETGAGTRPERVA